MEGIYRVHSPGSDDGKFYYDWAIGKEDNHARFKWLALHPEVFSDPTKTLKPFISSPTGLNMVGGDPEFRNFTQSDTAASVDFWQVIRETGGNGLERLRFYDKRSWAFPPRSP